MTIKTTWIIGKKTDSEFSVFFPLRFSFSKLIKSRLISSIFFLQHNLPEYEKFRIHKEFPSKLSTQVFSFNDSSNSEGLVARPRL